MAREIARHSTACAFHSPLRGPSGLDDSITIKVVSDIAKPMRLTEAVKAAG
jgi:hypothetical protein